MPPVTEEFQLAARLLVALVFVSAAIGKFSHLAEFQGVVARYRLLPGWLVTPIANGLPPAEAATGVALMAGSAAPWAAWAAIALLLVFALAMALNLLRGRRNIDCGCFQSALRQTLSWTLVLRNMLLAAVLVPTLAPSGAAAGGWTTATGLLAGGVLFLILQSLNILWGIVPAWHGPQRPARGASR